MIRSIAMAFAILVAVALPARGDATAPAVTWSLVGGCDLSFLIYDVVAIAKHKPPGLAFPIVEVAFGAAQLVAGPIIAVVGAGSSDSSAAWIGAGVTFAALAVALIAHGIWGVRTSGWGNAPRVHAR